MDCRLIVFPASLLLAHVLEKNNIIPIVCNISPFEELRQLARSKLRAYVQIYVKKDIATAQASDVKQIYQKNLNNSPIVGIDLAFDEPAFSDLIIRTSEESIEESLTKVINYLNEINKYEN